MTSSAPRPWDPTPREATVTREAVRLVAGFDEMIAQLQAQRALAMELVLDVALAQRERYERVPVGETRGGDAVFEPDDMPVRSAVAEVSAATRMSRRAVERELSEVWSLAHLFPAVREAFSRGAIDEARVSVLVGEGQRLSDAPLRAEYERLVIPVDAYKPTAEQRRYLRARDETCGFPWCERRAAGCDIDHVHDYALGGKTVVSNLRHLCRRHHSMKHGTAWSPRHEPNGDIAWRSPAGYEHVQRPASVVRFVEVERARAAVRRRRA